MNFVIQKALPILKGMNPSIEGTTKDFWDAVEAKKVELAADSTRNAVQQATQE